MNSSSILDYFNPRRVVLFFVSSNFLFLIIDILVAHSYNDFERLEEWIPVAYSALAGFGLFFYALLKEPSQLLRMMLRGILWLGVFVGGLGFMYHFRGATFREFSLKSLVYAAPLVAPFAYSGLSFVALVTEGLFERWGEGRKRLLFILTSGGFAGNLLLSIFDHARNGFFVATEWVPVFVSAFAFIVFLWAGIKRTISSQDAIAIHLAVGAAFVAGVAGFVLHLAADLHGIMPSIKDRFVYGAPIFAPLLFCDIAFLGLLTALMRDDFKGWISEVRGAH